MSAQILYIEDNIQSQSLIRSGLSGDYTVLTADDSEQGFTIALVHHPDLVLLDANLPGDDGYTLCERFRQTNETENIPIIFVSGMTCLEDRLRGYRAGADDYVCKPLDIAELKSKIAIHLARQREQGELQQQLSNASSTAMLAMTTNGETGAVLNFTIETYRCSDYESLAETTFEFLSRFGLRACMQLRAFANTHNLGSNQAVTPLESQILSSGAQADNIVNVRNKSIFNEEHITLLVKNMPVDDDALNGRMRDNLALAVKGIEARMQTLRLEEASRTARNEKLDAVIQQLRTQMQELDGYFGDLFDRIQRIGDELIMEAECRLMSLGLSSQQESELLETLKEGNRKLQDLQDHSQEVENRFLGLEGALIEATLL